MDPAKKAKLEAAGWTEASIEKFLGLSEDSKTLQYPGHSHALGCCWNGMPVIECACGLPNKPKDS